MGQSAYSAADSDSIIGDVFCDFLEPHINFATIHPN